MDPQMKMYFPIENGDIPAIAMLVYQRALVEVTGDFFFLP